LKTDQETFFFSIFLVSPVALIIFVLLAYYLYISIYKPINTLISVTETVSQGNLILNFKSSMKNDEIGKLERSFSKMNNNFSSIITQINNATRMLTSTTEQLASSSEEVNSASEEISALTQTISEGAQSQNLKLNNLITMSNDFKLTFEKKITEISQTSSLIENISSQVNILSLNASIEAARAGEYGRGFSVVAENIRKLADESKNSVNKVQETIQKMNIDLSNNITLLIESVDSVTELAHNTAISSEEASAATEEQSAIMEEISASSLELATISKNLEITNQLVFLYITKLHLLTS
jgi:methyl-accepting chemotaxis protein